MSESKSSASSANPEAFATKFQINMKDTDLLSLSTCFNQILKSFYHTNVTIYLFLSLSPDLFSI